MNEAVSTANILASEKFPALTQSAWENAISCWDEPHRRWHGRHHLESLIGAIDSEAGLSDSDREMLGYVALFHDAVYDPFSSSNEEDSARMAAKALTNYSRKNEVLDAILATKTHQAGNDLVQKFNQWDCAILSETRWDKLLDYEAGIAFEYRSVESATYRRERGRFLRSAAQTHRNPQLARLANEVDPG